MKAFEFLEAKYVEINLQLQREFTVAKQAEAQAAQKLIDAQRSLYRKIMYIKLIINYVLVLAGYASKPQSAMDQVKAIREEAAKNISAENVLPIKE